VAGRCARTRTHRAAHRRSRGARWRLLRAGGEPGRPPPGHRPRRPGRVLPVDRRRHRSVGPAAPVGRASAAGPGRARAGVPGRRRLVPAAALGWRSLDQPARGADELRRPGARAEGSAGCDRSLTPGHPHRRRRSGQDPFGPRGRNQRPLRDARRRLAGGARRGRRRRGRARRHRVRPGGPAPPGRISVGRGHRLPPQPATAPHRRQLRTPDRGDRTQDRRRPEVQPWGRGPGDEPGGPGSGRGADRPHTHVHRLR